MHDNLVPGEIKTRLWVLGEVQYEGIGWVYGVRECVKWILQVSLDQVKLFIFSNGVFLGN